MNQYPMKTKIEGTIVRNCRLVAEDGITTVWQWDKDRDTAVPLRQTPSAPERVGASQKWQVDDLAFEPQRGCGCQHPMYTFVPPVQQQS